MTQDYPALGEVAKGILSFEPGDIVAVSSWIGWLEDAKPTLAPGLGDRVDDFIEWLRSALRRGMPDDFVAQAGRRLEQLQEAPPVQDDLWSEHGPLFLSEASHRLDRAQQIILSLEHRPDQASFDELFRLVHTIKGEAGFLRLGELESHTHALEGILDELRLGTTTWTPAQADTLLAGFDRIRRLLPTAAPAGGPHRAEGPAASGGGQQEILRIPAGKIDALIALVGELLVATENETAEVGSLVRKLGKSLQQEALRLRTEPLGTLVGKLRRGVRDLSRDLGKPVEFRVSGEELELDRTLVANLEEPLLHLIRNALDHGIEPEGQRLKAGKPPVGVVALTATRKGNLISLGLTDDGRGLDADRIWAKACQLGLVTGPQPTDRDAVLNQVFRPGFSTAETVTSVSGRGVGMDVVATMVQANRGRVRLESEPGRGTRVVLEFPLSTAVVEGLVVRTQGRRYLIPVHSVEETLFLTREARSLVAQGNRIFSLRGVPLPVHALDELLGLAPNPATPAWAVVVTGDRGRMLVLVDEVEAKREAVIRSLGPGFRHLRGIPAATILAGGGLALVLDLDQLGEASR